MATLDFYNRHSEEYSEKTFGADLSVLREDFLSCLPLSGSILDLGCGSGRDAYAFSERGYSVTAVDGSEGMCEAARKNTGLEVIRKNFSELDYAGEFDGVWASCSLLHVPSAELPEILGKIDRALKPNGIFYCSFKKGDFEGEREERYYTDMTVGRLTDLVCDNGFLPIRTWESPEPGRDLVWVNSLSRKW